MDDPAVALAGRAAELSTDLYGLGERCGHDQTSTEISNIAGELTLLSTTLWRLHEAMAANSDAYTVAFSDDLNEITSELTLLFDEVSECCVEMQKIDTPGAPVSYFFKKGRVSKLQKHLEALKTTLVVMRTVLHHGKEYGVQNSPGRLAESTPHTMVEDRAILESVFAKNRNAIMDLHEMEKTRGHNHSSSTSSTSAADIPKTTSSSDEGYLPGARGHNLSNATGVEVPPIPDVLPISPKKKKKASTDGLSRRFSKRGVRLGVHMSILDLGAHEAPSGLRKKWLSQAKNNGEHGHRVMSTIAEDSVHNKTTKGKERQIDGSEENGDDGPSVTATPPHRSDSNESTSKARTRANSLMGSPLGKAVSKAIRRLSLSNVMHGQRSDESESGSGVKSESSSDNMAGGNDNGHATGNGNGGGGGGGIKKKISIQKDRLEARLMNPVLRTPDYNQEFENGRW